MHDLFNIFICKFYMGRHTGIGFSVKSNEIGIRRTGHILSPTTSMFLKRHLLLNTMGWFASLWSADLACTDSSDEAFKKQVAKMNLGNGSRNSRRRIFSRVTKATGPIAYRKMNEPINTIVDGEYYINLIFMQIQTGSFLHIKDCHLLIVQIHHRQSFWNIQFLL